MNEMTVLASAEGLPLDKLNSLREGIDEIQERKTNDDMASQINEKIKHVNSYTGAYVDYTYHPATQRRNEEEFAECLLLSLRDTMTLQSISKRNTTASE